MNPKVQISNHILQRVFTISCKFLVSWYIISFIYIGCFGFYAKKFFDTLTVNKANITHTYKLPVAIVNGLNHGMRCWIVWFLVCFLVYELALTQPTSNPSLKYWDNFFLSTILPHVYVYIFFVVCCFSFRWNKWFYLVLLVRLLFNVCDICTPHLLANLLAGIHGVIG